MKVKRHDAIEMIEHWTLAVSGILLLFTGIGELPLFKRYYFILDIPGLSWAGDYFIHLKLHYVFATFFTAAVLFHIVFHTILGESGLLPRKGDLRRSVRVLLASIGIGKEPESEKYLPEQRVAYAGIGFVILLLTVTGVFKLVKNIPDLYIPPSLNGINTLIHTLAAVLFLVSFVAHLGALLVPANFPLPKSMFTGKVDLAYVKRRHGLWHHELETKGLVPAGHEEGPMVERDGPPAP